MDWAYLSFGRLSIAKNRSVWRTKVREAKERWGQILRYKDHIKRELKALEIDVNNCEQQAADRTAWR